MYIIVYGIIDLKGNKYMYHILCGITDLIRNKNLLYVHVE